MSNTIDFNTIGTHRKLAIIQMFNEEFKHLKNCIASVISTPDYKEMLVKAGVFEAHDTMEREAMKKPYIGIFASLWGGYDTYDDALSAVAEQCWEHLKTFEKLNLSKDLPQ